MSTTKEYFSDGSKSNKSSKPLLPPSLILAVYFIIICCTGQTIAAIDPIQEMLKMNNSLSYITDPLERENTIKAVVGLGLSFSVLAGMVVGLFLDFAGPKVTAITGMLLQVSGLLLLFFTDRPTTMAIGAICLGFAFQAILNCHMSVTVFFPSNINLVLAFIGAAPDMSLFMPTTLGRIATYLNTGTGNTTGMDTAGNTGVRNVIIGYIIIVCGTCFILDLLFVPFRPFQAAGESLERQASLERHVSLDKSQRGSSDHLTTIPEGIQYGSVPVQQQPVSYTDMTVKQQLFTSHYWVMVPFFVLNFCRRKHFASNIRSIFIQITGGTSTGGKWADLFNTLVPFGFLPALIWGVVSDRFGTTASMFLCNICGVIVSGLAAVPGVYVPAGIILFYILNSSYVFGILFAFCANTYGFVTLATLQGIASTSAGLMSLLMDSKWNHFISNNLKGSFTKASIIVMFVGIGMFITPIYMSVFPPGGRRQQTPACRPVFTGRSDTTGSLYYTTGQVYDRMSLAMIRRTKNHQRLAQSEYLLNRSVYNI